MHAQSLYGDGHGGEDAPRILGQLYPLGSVAKHCGQKGRHLGGTPSGKESQEEKERKRKRKRQWGEEKEKEKERKEKERKEKRERDGGERQRELSYRFGINIAMYALTGNYKSDQIHSKSILKRLSKSN